MRSATADAVQAYFASGDYLAGNPLIPIRAELVAQLLADVRDGRVLDLGCGDGAISRPLLGAGNRLTLVDFSAAMLERARERTPDGAPVEFVEADILQYVAAAPYDAVICVGVLAHVPDVPRAISVVAEAVRPGGLAVLQLTDDASVAGWLLGRYYALRSRQRYRLGRTRLPDIVRAAAERGLTVRESRRYGLLVPGLGRLPGDLEGRVERVVAFHPRLAAAGAEILVSFVKRS